ncbi:MAG: DNA mismatch repair endonuclease MutL [Firmicutes bacterium]|nr:DNA mismatch repair endonuclease MutL [Bacillota bacterium]
MQKINVLPPHVYNLLSAGEVVENPSAIVKECVENSLDAGATSVVVEIERGGLDLVRITDNGHGVLNSEVEKVFLPHATSKIRDAKDIDAIGTLGFRGEAMASIASVSMSEFLTRTKDEATATCLTIHGGKTISKKQQSREVGTTVTVRNLFYNTPARAKFLRSTGTEKNAVTKIITGFILANPSVSFKYIIDGDIVFACNGKTLKEAINTVYNAVPSGELLDIKRDKDGVKVHGFVSSPQFTRPNRTYQTIIVNGRVVDDTTTQGAVNNAFGNFVTTGNYPFFVLCIEINPEFVDVNIHPRKLNIKFSNPDLVSTIVHDAVMSGIDGYLKQKHTVNFDKNKDTEFLERMAFFKAADNNKVMAADNIMNHFDLMERPVVKKPVQKSVQQTMDTETVQSVRVLGTIFDTYILVDDGALHIIDQHAAHERLLFDQMMLDVKANNIPTQKLLSPMTLALSVQEMQRVESLISVLEDCGIVMQPFGTNAYRITHVPMIIQSGDIDSLVSLVLGEKDIRGAKLSDLMREKIIKHCCHLAVRAGDKISNKDISDLLNRFAKKDTPLVCPHGRPIVISFTKQEIEKMIARR